MSAEGHHGSGISIWDLWSECARESETLGDPLFLECLEAASARRIFDDLTDEKLKASFSLINSLLNDPKTRAKGLTLLNDLSSQINPSRLVAYQDALTSALHLVVKGLDSPLASTVLTNFLPKCHSMSEINQTVTSSIIPKILAHFCEDGGASGKDVVVQKSLEELQLLKTCLTEYHGPCGQYRDKLERILVQLIDSESKGEIVEFLGGVMPLLSYAGGGGNAGEKHTKDWNKMLTKFLKTTYETLYQLYGGSCATLEPENPFDGELLPGHKKITETQVLLRMSLLKRRLLNLLTVTSGYFRSPFPAPKLVPQKGTLKLIEFLTLVNPAAYEKSNSKGIRKETLFLSAIVPGIHSNTLTLLRSLMYCIGSNILIDGTSVEQLIASEFKWIQERPRAYGMLKLELYETLITWLTVTGGIVTNLKTLAVWVNAIGSDTSVDKDVIELKLLTKTKSGKSVKSKTSSVSLSMNPASITTTTSQTYALKDSEVCQIALKTLSYLIPSLDTENHRKIYEHLVKTASILTQFDEAPSPYASPQCRLIVFETVTRLAYNPHPRSPVCLALIVSLLRQGVQDPTKLVSSFCSCQIANLERLMHPTSAPLALSGPSSVPVALDNTRNYSRFTNEAADEDSSDNEQMTIDDTDIPDRSHHSSHGRNHQTATPTEGMTSSSNFESLENEGDNATGPTLGSVLTMPSTSDSPVKSNNPPQSDCNLPTNGLDHSVHTIDEDSDDSDILIIEDNGQQDSQKVNGMSAPSNNDENDHPSSQSDVNGRNANVGTSNDEHGELDERGLISENDDLTGKKRKTAETSQSPTEDETITGEIQVKKAKTMSPVKAPDADPSAPSVQEMLEAFIDRDFISTYY